MHGLSSQFSPPSVIKIICLSPSIPLKSFFIKEENVSKLLSYCSSSYYSQFYILNNEGKVVKKIGEKELVKNFLNMKY